MAGEVSDHRTLISSRRLWDGTGSPAIQDAALRIEGKRIVAVGKQQDLTPEPGEARVDLGNVTLLPGFVDMHIHLDDAGWTSLRLLANGITTVRDTGNNARALLALRERQRQGSWTGPRIFTYGPLIDAAPPYWAHVALPIADAAETEALVCALIQQGVDGLKTYARATPEIVQRVLAEAHRNGKKVTCHAGATPVTEALAMGMDGAEHVFCLDVKHPGQEWADVDAGSPRVKEQIDRFLTRGAWFTPTLAVMRACQLHWGRPFDSFPGFAEYPACLRRWLKESLAERAGANDWDAARIAQAEAGFRRMQEVAAAFHQAGVPLLAGSDSPFVPVGIGFHYELELLVEAGLPNDAVLAMATRQGAEFLGGSDRFGTLQPGMLADVVAVPGDPLRDIRATRRVTALWQEGRRLDPAMLGDAAEILVSVAPSEFSEERPPFGIYGEAEKGDQPQRHKEHEEETQQHRGTCIRRWVSDDSLNPLCLSLCSLCLCG
jgi:imidazolonepropionase-like amidohydrolase